MLSSQKIRFIEPQGRHGRPFNPWISRWPLLGPITLASILHDRGYDARVYNENISGSIPDNPAAYEDICSADIVGVSIMTSTAARGYAIADRIKRDAPNVKVVFGGVHATFLPDEALPHGDIVVRGEGETVIEQIADGRIHSGIIQAPHLEDLNSIPTLNHALMNDFDKLIAGSRKKEIYELPIMASRGCPYGCTFCSVTRMFGRKVRRQSVAKVYRDICRYAEQGFRRFFFYDDNLTSDRVWARELFDRMAPMRLRFNAQVRADFHWLDGSRNRVDRPLLGAMRRGGGDVVYVGYETIDEATATRWGKGYRGANSLRGRLAEDTRILHDSGFWIHGMFVLGPEHTTKTADQIVQFANQNNIESMQISILTPLPGTPLFDQMRPYLVFTDYPSDWNYYDGTHCVYNNSRLGIEKLQKTVLKAHRRFYRRGMWNFRRIRALVEQKLPFADKLALLWTHATLARKTLKEWREETKLFLELAKARTAK